MHRHSASFVGLAGLDSAQTGQARQHFALWHRPQLDHLVKQQLSSSHDPAVRVLVVSSRIQPVQVRFSPLRGRQSERMLLSVLLKVSPWYWTLLYQALTEKENLCSWGHVSRIWQSRVESLHVTLQAQVSIYNACRFIISVPCDFISLCFISASKCAISFGRFSKAMD